MKTKRNWQKTKRMLAWAASITIVYFAIFIVGVLAIERKEFLLLLAVVCLGSWIMAGVNGFLRKKWFKSEISPDNEKTKN